MCINSPNKPQTYTPSRTGKPSPKTLQERKKRERRYAAKQLAHDTSQELASDPPSHPQSQSGFLISPCLAPTHNARSPRRLLEACVPRIAQYMPFEAQLLSAWNKEIDGFICQGEALNMDSTTMARALENRFPELKHVIVSPESLERRILILKHGDSDNFKQGARPDTAEDSDADTWNGFPDSEIDSETEDRHESEQDVHNQLYHNDASGGSTESQDQEQQRQQDYGDFFCQSSYEPPSSIAKLDFLRMFKSLDPPLPLADTSLPIIDSHASSSAKSVLSNSGTFLPSTGILPGDQTSAAQEVEFLRKGSNVGIQEFSTFEMLSKSMKEHSAQLQSMYKNQRQFEQPTVSTSGVYQCEHCLHTFRDRGGLKVSFHH